MILSICSRENSEYSFSIWNTVSIQTYQEANIDYTTFTGATLYFKKVNDVVANEVSVAISDSDLQYLFADGGLTINFADFGEALINGFTYFPDYLYEIRIVYTYDGAEYEASTTIGFLVIIKRVVYQQMMKSNWKKELACNCGCDGYSATMRKWNYFRVMQWAAELCLVDEYINALEALYKLTGTDYEFD
jgi:hypothetical protein